MKILLVGEFSGVHNNLANALRAENHEVTIAADGDGWKKFSSDLSVVGSHESSRLKKIAVLIKFMTRAVGYDIVQIISVAYIMRPYMMLLMTLYLKLLNKRCYFLAAGCDPLYYRGAQSFPFSPCASCQKEDLRKACAFSSATFFFISKMTLKLSNGIIPMLPEYSKSYRKFVHVRDIIPFPGPIVPLEHSNLITFYDPRETRKIRILHGINRPGFKGSSQILEGLKLAKLKLQDKIEVTIVERLSFNEYQKKLRETDIVIDQIWAATYGMNALFALTMGKVVVASLDENSLTKTFFSGCPIVKVKQDPQDICEKICQLVESSEKLSILQRQGIEYSLKVHHHQTIAKSFMESWALDV